MYYVYLIRSEADATRTYIGFTSDLHQRMTKHNTGGSRHTSKYQRAREFEYYPKTGSGQAFAKERLW
jgi:predicted GIY-YIG superfamily endonuclease